MPWSDNTVTKASIDCQSIMRDQANKIFLFLAVILWWNYLEKSMADPDMIPKMMPSDDLINDELMNHFGGKELE